MKFDFRIFLPKSKWIQNQFYSWSINPKEEGLSHLKLRKRKSKKLSEKLFMIFSRKEKDEKPNWISVDKVNDLRRWDLQMTIWAEMPEQAIQMRAQDAIEKLKATDLSILLRMSWRRNVELQHTAKNGCSMSRSIAWA